MALQGMPVRRGDWMITVSGRRFYPLDPHPEDVDFDDMAHHLARICRYGGAVSGWYSVAEHSCLMADHFMALGDLEAARYAHVHDGPEYVINDMIRPLKPELPDFQRIEAPIERAILVRLGLAPSLPARVKEADSLIIGDERIQLFSAEALARSQWLEKPCLGVTCRQWERDQAKAEWLSRFRALFPEQAV
jgi:hypothetical protein